MDESVKLPDSDAYDALDTTTFAETDSELEFGEQAASVTNTPSARSRRELERYMEERALEKELDALWQ